MSNRSFRSNSRALASLLALLVVVLLVSLALVPHEHLAGLLAVLRQLGAHLVVL